MPYAVGFIVLGVISLGGALRAEANGRWWLQWLVLSAAPLMLVPARVLVTQDLTAQDVVWTMGAAVWSILVICLGRPSRMLPDSLLPDPDDREVAYRVKYRQRGTTIMVVIGIGAMVGAVFYVFELSP